MSEAKGRKSYRKVLIVPSVRESQRREDEDKEKGIGHPQVHGFECWGTKAKF